MRRSCFTFIFTSATAGITVGWVALFLAACAVGLSASIDLLIELTSFGGGIDAAFSALIGYAAVLPIAAATAWWALQETGKRSAT